MAWSWFRQNDVISSRPPAGNANRWAHEYIRLSKVIENKQSLSQKYKNVEVQMRSLLEIQQLIQKLALPINAPPTAMPTYDNFRYDGTPNIEVGDSVYYYRAFGERGGLSMNRQTNNLAELLYWVFEDITYTMAREFEEKHPNPAVDFRKIYFEHQLDLLEKVNHEWAVQREKEIAEMLINAPYRVP